jgi:putative ABC transport system permease protein
VNFRLAAYLAWRSLRHHRIVAAATILGVALGMVVVAAILIVDYHSIQTQVQAGLTEVPKASPGKLHILRVSFERLGQTPKPAAPVVFPSQEGQVGRELSSAAPPARRGEEDYQAMRLAVRLASLLAFAVGAVIVFYTMRFSVVSRSREFCLLLCLGERRGNVVLSLLLETLGLGAAGTLAGLLAAFPAAYWLIQAGVSTTGRVPSGGYAVPGGELAVLAGLSVLVALLAVAGPARAIVKMGIVEVLQPRFLSAGIDGDGLRLRGFAWLMPPLMAAAYLALRPFLLSWLSVVQFFLLESAFVLALALAVLWWMSPLLRGLIWLTEALLKPALPLETLLAGRRLRLASQKLVFTIVGVTLVFSLLTALHDITRSLKHEIQQWADDALSPYVFFQRNSSPVPMGEQAFQQVLERQKLFFFRLSEKTHGEFPIRLALGRDVNPYLLANGMAPLLPGTVIVSRTLAARFALKVGDAVLVDSENGSGRFTVANVTDEVGFYAEDDEYVNLKSYLLFSDGNPLFADNLERSLGRYGVARMRGGGYLGEQAVMALQPLYDKFKDGYSLKVWQKAEIDRDFMIFDFILAMTVVLAAVGVANTILIQVHGRRREFSVLRSLGISRAQTMRLLLVEGAIIGLLAALLSLALGHAMGAISVSFLDRFTLFDYEFVFSFRDSALVSLLAVLVCCAAAVYPGWIANRVSSAESLHYE